LLYSSLRYKACAALIFGKKKQAYICYCCMKKVCILDSGIYRGKLVIGHFYKRLFKTGEITYG
jgi:hypothetical protein